MEAKRKENFALALKIWPKDAGVPEDAVDGWRGTPEQKADAETQFKIKISSDPKLWVDNAWTPLISTESITDPNRKTFLDYMGNTTQYGNGVEEMLGINIGKMIQGYMLEFLGSTHYLEYGGPAEDSEPLCKTRHMVPTTAYWDVMGYISKTQRVCMPRTRFWGFNPDGTKVDIKTTNPPGTMGGKLGPGWALFTSGKKSSPENVMYTLKIQNVDQYMEFACKPHSFPTES